MARPAKYARANLILAAVLLAAALAIRIADVEATTYKPIGDARSYLVLATQIAHTGAYTTSHAPGAGAGGTRGPTAYYPPAFPYLLAAVDLIDGHTSHDTTAAVHGARLAQAVLGTITVALVGLIALEAFGSVLIALIALGIAAVYPVLVELSSTLVAENLMSVLVLAAAWAALRARRAARPYLWLAAAGVLTGLATLAHENAIVILIPLVFAAYSRGGARATALLIATTAITLSPWAIRNAIELHRFIPVSDETGVTLVGTYNNAASADRTIPYRWRIYYAIPGERQRLGPVRRLTEPGLSDRLQDQATDFIGAHPSAPLSASLHNTLRLLELEGSFAWRASAYGIGIGRRAATIGVVSFWLLCIAALAGALTYAVRRAPRWLWFVPFLLALSVVPINAETPRFRAPIDPFLIPLAASALAGAAAVVRTRGRLRRPPVGGDRGATVAGRDAQLVEMVKRLT